MRRSISRVAPKHVKQYVVRSYITRSYALQFELLPVMRWRLLVTMSGRSGKRSRQDGGGRGGGGGGGGAGGGKKSKYFQAVRIVFAARSYRLLLNSQHRFQLQNSKATLPVGSRGVLISCIGGKEQYAAKDSIRILTEVLGLASCGLLDSSATQLAALMSGHSRAMLSMQYYERLKGTEEPAVTAKPADISSAIADEVAELKSPKGQLFVHHKVNVFGLIFIGFHTPNTNPTPSEVVQAAARDVLKTKQCLSKYACCNLRNQLLAC